LSNAITAGALLVPTSAAADAALSESLMGASYVPVDLESTLKTSEYPYFAAVVAGPFGSRIVVIGEHDRSLILHVAFMSDFAGYDLGKDHR